MMSTDNPYDELNYRSRPIEWTAPERLALTSILHGGPRTNIDNYRVLELGCADGANLLPLAYYRRNSEFIGIDFAETQIDLANSRKADLKITNVEFVNMDFMKADSHIDGDFDFIIAHGIFSWLSRDVRDAVLELCRKRLRPNGLFYLNYNTKPGWNIRGMVRDYLVSQTADVDDLDAKARKAQEVSAKVASAMRKDDHHFAQLMANEFKFVCDHHFSYVAHEYLAEENHPYWRSEFLELIGESGFEYVADADFCYDSGRISDELADSIQDAGLSGRSLEDTADLFCYRQLHSPILTRSPLKKQMPDHSEYQDLFIASCLVPTKSDANGNPMFEHPNGCQVEAKDTTIYKALNQLQSIWPRGLRIGEIFNQVDAPMEDLLLLQRNGLVELRCIDAADFDIDPRPLNHLEIQFADFRTTCYHTREDFLSNSELENMPSGILVS